MTWSKLVSTMTWSRLVQNTRKQKLNVSGLNTMKHQYSAALVYLFVVCVKLRVSTSWSSLLCKLVYVPVTSLTNEAVMSVKTTVKSDGYEKQSIHYQEQYSKIKQTTTKTLFENERFSHKNRHHLFWNKRHAKSVWLSIGILKIKTKAKY